MIVLPLALALLATALPQDRAALWRKDIDSATAELPKLHKDLFHKISRQDWHKSAEAAKKELGDQPTVARFAVAMMRHIARVGDGHTTFTWQWIGLPACPLKLMSFEEGVFVLGYGNGDARLAGARLVKIDGMPVAKVIAALSPLIPHENPVLLDLKAPQIMVVPALLHELGIAKKADRLQLTLVDQKGKRFETEMRALPPKSLQKTRYRYSFTKVPMCLEKGRSPFWYRYLEDRKALYLKYNQCKDAKGFGELVQKMWKSVEDKPVDKLIIDVRHNGGGSSVILQALTATFVKHKKTIKNGLYVIIGRNTFSSALLNATMLKRAWHATLVGEATAGKPNHFGEIKQLKLPESHLTIFYSTKYFKKVENDPSSLHPDRQVPLSAKAFFAGKDPFLEAVFTDK